MCSTIVAEQASVVLDAELVRHRQQQRVGGGDRRILRELLGDPSGSPVYVRPNREIAPSSQPT